MTKTVFQQLIHHFETRIQPNTKLTAHERLLFLSGASFVVFMINNHVREANESGDLQKSMAFTQLLKKEAWAFYKTELKKYHKFFCTDCSEGEEHGAHS